MPKNYYQSISLLMAYDKLCAFVKETLNLIGFSINSNLSLASRSLVGAGMPW